MRRQPEKQDKTGQLAATLEDGLNRKHWWGNQVKNHQEHLQDDKQKKENTNRNNSKYTEHSFEY